MSDLLLQLLDSRHAAARRGDEDLTELRRLATRFAEATDDGEREQADADFHTAIAAAGGNPLFARLVTDLRAVLREQAGQVTSAPGRQEQEAGEHREIYQAIADGDADAAGRAMQRHLGAAITADPPPRGEH